MQTIQTGETINAYIKSQEKCKQYKLGNILGVGTGGIVYEAENIWDESDIIAVKKEKEVFGNTLELYKVLEEKRLDNVVNILFVQKDYGKSYFIGMDKGDGSITDLFQSESLSQKEIDEMIKQVANGIYSIHANKIIHRDLKPDNIVYKKRSEGDYYYMICDLGLAKQHNEAKDQESQNVKLTTNIGTPIYMAPELFLDKNYDSSVDIWAFGVMIYQLLSKQELFQGKSIQQVYNQISGYKQKELDKNFSEFLKLPQHYQILLKKMLNEEPKDRISIKLVLEELDKEKLEQAQQKYGQAYQFSEWEIFKKNLHPDIKVKILNIQAKLRPLFVKQRDLINEILMKIGEDLEVLRQTSKSQIIMKQQGQVDKEEISSQTMQRSEIQIGIQYSQQEKDVIMKHSSEYMRVVKDLYQANSNK